MTWDPDELLVQIVPDRVEIRLRVDQDGHIYRDFSLQLVAIVNGEHHPVVRYDTSHGASPHRDILNWDGSTHRKDPMWEGLSYREAFEEAYDDLYIHYDRYIEAFLRRRP